VRAVLTIGVALLLALTACKQHVAPAKPAAPPTALTFSFDSAARGGKTALLHYAVHTAGGAKPMRISDPKSPVGTQVDLPQGKLKIAPFVCKPVITNAHMEQCQVSGCYTLCLRDPAGTHIGDFEINPWGALVLKCGTTKEPAYVARAGSPTRTVYFVYDKKPSGGHGPLRFALEYQRRQYVNNHKLTGSDGWNYDFQSPDGSLLIYQPDAVRLLFQKLNADADEANKKTLAELEDWTNRKNINGLTIAGGETAPSGGYCTGGG